MYNPEAEVDFSVVDLVDNPAGEMDAMNVDSSLPVKFFGLESHPFLDNVNPEFFFRTEAHEDAYMKMKYCIEHHIAIGLTTAISGTGKTLLTQILLNELDESKCKPVVVMVYPSMSSTALLKEIMRELELDEDMPARPRIDQMVSAIQDEIMRLHEEGIKLVIIIDEVHFLKAPALHMLRTLSNIETPGRKLITILLFGEETFLKRMGQPGYRALFSRMFVRKHLRPLYEEEVEQYMKFRMLMSGGSADIFEPETFAYIFERTNGIPREINRLCHVAITLAAKYKQRTVTVDLMKKITDEF